MIIRRSFFKLFLFVSKGNEAPVMSSYNSNLYCTTVKELRNFGKKKIDKSINFLRGWEEKMVSIFRLGRCEKVGLSLGPNVARSEIYT